MVGSEGSDGMTDLPPIPENWDSTLRIGEPVRSLDDCCVGLMDGPVGITDPWKAVCQAEVVYCHVVRLAKWPSRWVRFWHWFFFGIVWRPVK